MRISFASLGVTVLIAVVVAGAACTFDTATPPGAVIACVKDDECPTGQQCNALTARCVDVDARDEAAPVVVEGPTLTPDRGGLETTFVLDIVFDAALANDPTAAATINGAFRPFVVDEDGTDRESHAYRMTFSPDTRDIEGEWPVDVAWFSVANVQGGPIRAGTITLDFNVNVVDAPATLAGLPTLAPTSGGLDTTFVVDVAFSGALGADPQVLALIGDDERAFNIDVASTNREAGTFRFSYSPTTEDAEGTWPVDLVWTSPLGTPALPERVGTISLDFSGAIVSAQLSPEVARAGTTVSLSVTTSEPTPDDVPPTLVFEGDNDPGFVLTSSAGTLHVFTLDVTCTPFAACDPPDDEYTLRSIIVTDQAGNVREELLDDVVLVVDTQVPTIQQLTANRAVYSAVPGFNDAIVTFSVDEIVDDATIDVAFAGIALACGTRAQTRPHYTCTGVVDEGAPEGAGAIVVGVVDAAGNVGAATLPITLDFTAPSIEAGSVAVDLIGAPGAVTAPTFASFGTTARVLFSADEPLDEEPVVDAVPADTPPGQAPAVQLPMTVAAFTAERITDARLLFSDPATPADDYGVRAALVDKAGNAATVVVPTPPAAIVFQASVPSPCVEVFGGCTDFDRDGQFGASLNCTGFTDCDDSNPAVHLGALEIPGDALDNDCAGDGDIPIDESVGVFVDPVNGTAGAPGTRAAPVDTITEGIQRANGSSKRTLFLASGTYAGFASGIIDNVVGSLDPVTWTPSAERSNVGSASFARSVLTRVRSTGVSMFACDRAAIVDVVVSGNAGLSVGCEAVVVDYVAENLGQSTFNNFSVTASYIISGSRMDNMFFSAGSQVIIDRSFVGSVGAPSNGTVVVTNSRARGFTRSGSGGALPDVRIIHSGIETANFSVFDSVALTVLNSWIAVGTGTFGELVIGSATLTTQDVAWSSASSGATVLSFTINTPGIGQLNDSPGSHDGNLFVTDVQSFDGLRVLPSSPVIDEGRTLSQTFTALTAGDIDGECRSDATPDLGPDELP